MERRKGTRRGLELFLWERKREKGKILGYRLQKGRNKIAQSTLPVPVRLHQNILLGSRVLGNPFRDFILDSSRPDQRIFPN